MDPTAPAPAGLSPTLTLLLGVIAALGVVMAAALPAWINRSGKSRSQPMVVDTTDVLNRLGGHDEALRMMEHELVRYREEEHRLRAEVDLWRQRAYTGWSPP